MTKLMESFNRNFRREACAKGNFRANIRRSVVPVDSAQDTTDAAVFESTEASRSHGQNCWRCSNSDDHRAMYRLLDTAAAAAVYQTIWRIGTYVEIYSKETTFRDPSNAFLYICCVFNHEY